MIQKGDSFFKHIFSYSKNIHAYIYTGFNKKLNNR